MFNALNTTSVIQGFARSDPPDDAPSEAALVTVDPSVLPLRDLVAVHLASHSSRSAHTMRGKYRSAIYAGDADIDDVTRALALDAVPGTVTRVLALRGFEASAPAFRNYYETRGPDAPFCARYIGPKLAALRRTRPHLLAD